jgi:hypothetical protein
MFDKDELILSEIITDGIDLTKNGFVKKYHAYTINIYYVENESVVYISGEASCSSLYDFIIYGEIANINKRYFPKTQMIGIIPFNERLKIQDKLIKWLDNEKIKNDLKLGV